MSAEEVKAAVVSPPWDAGSNEFGVMKFSGGVAATETTHSANAIPNAWRGQWVEIFVVAAAASDRMHYAFSTNSSAEVDRSVAATAAGASAKVGGVVAHGERVHVRVPNSSATVYFVRESTATGLVAYLRLASGKE